MGPPKRVKKNDRERKKRKREDDYNDDEFGEGMETEGSYTIIYIIKFRYHLIISIKVYLYLLLPCGQSHTPGSPFNLTVTIFEDFTLITDNNELGTLRFNISWSPAASSPTSYSILITSLPERAEGIACPVESIFHTTWNVKQCSIVLPENQFFSQAPELTIRPGCTYEVEVYANPRISFNSTVEKLDILIPDCVGRLCTCDQAATFLPVPTDVKAVVLASNAVFIEWTIEPDTLSNSTASFIIKCATPILISNTGLAVYNTSRIASVSANTSSYLWPLDPIDPAVTGRQKISVAAEDAHGCSGNASEFFLELAAKETNIQQLNWLMLWISLLGVCTGIIVLLSYLWNRGQEKYKLILSKQQVHSISQCNWLHSILKKNILYADQNIANGITSQGDVDQLEIAFSRLSIADELGKGHFGQVYLGYLDGEGDFPVAVKMSNSSDAGDSSEPRHQLLDEIATMKRVGQHPHLVKLIGYCTVSTSPICIILEYISGGDLLGYLHKLRDYKSPEVVIIPSTGLSTVKDAHSAVSSTLWLNATCPALSSDSITPEDYNTRSYINVEYNNSVDNRLAYSTSGKIDNDQFISFALEIAHGMHHLESLGIVHRDLAARNILVTSNLRLKISDFGLSRDGVYVISKSGAGVRRLPVRWMAPEALRDRAFTSKSDVWSYAVVLWEIATLGAFPYAQVRDDELLQFVLNDEGRLSRPVDISTMMYELMRRCWSSRAEDRPNFTEILRRINASDDAATFFITSNPGYSLVSASMDMICEKSKIKTDCRING